MELRVLEGCTSPAIDLREAGYVWIVDVDIDIEDVPCGVKVDRFNVCRFRILHTDLSMGLMLVVC